MRDLPAGTVTFMFTDIEGPTKLLHERGAERYAESLAARRRAALPGGRGGVSASEVAEPVEPARAADAVRRAGAGARRGAQPATQRRVSPADADGSRRLRQDPPRRPGRRGAGRGARARRL